MVGVTVSSIGVIAMFMIGASGLAVNPGYRPRALDLTERDVEPMVARAISLPRRGMEEILAEKEKRCIQPSDSLTPDSATCNSSAADGDTLSDLSLPESHASIGDVHALPDKSRASSSGTFTGDLTFYQVGLGACGFTNRDSDMVAAVSIQMYDGFDGFHGDSNNNPICRKKAVITYRGKTITVTIVDACEACAFDDLDLSPTAFSRFANENVGRLHGATWHFA